MNAASRLWPIGAVALLGAACALWSGLPLGSSGAPGALALAVACGSVACGVVRLVRLGAGPAEPDYALSWWQRLLDEVVASALGTGWETGAVIAAAVAEALHTSRPWHTGVLAVLALGYLLAVHQAESGQPAKALRDQARTVSVGIGAVGVITGVAMLPAAGAGAGAVAAWLEAAAALAAVVAGGLVLPI